MLLIIIGVLSICALDEISGSSEKGTTNWEGFLITASVKDQEFFYINIGKGTTLEGDPNYVNAFEFLGGTLDDLFGGMAK